MTTYYVSTAGSNSNNGLGPDASHATNKPYLTLGKAVNTGSAVLPGDTVYIAPGTYFDATCTPLSAITSAGSPTQIIGDPTNAQGFKDGSGVRLAPGLAWLTTRTAAEGIDGPIVTNNTINLILLGSGGNNPHGLQFKKLCLEASREQYAITLNAAGCDNTLVEDCYFSGHGLMRVNTGALTASRGWTVRRCVVLGNAVFDITTTAPASDNINLGIIIEENLVLLACFLNTVSGVLSLGTSGARAGGIAIKNNIWVGGKGNGVLATAALQVSLSVPIGFKGNLFIGQQAVISCGTSGQAVDDGYNRVIGISEAAGLTSTNFTWAGTSLHNVQPNLVLPHLVNWGLELPRADFLGWTDAAATAQKFSASGAVTSDLRGRTARPWGAGASIGCWQAQDVAQDTSSAITGGGTNSLKLTGAGEVSLYIPVDAAGFTVSVRTKSTSYGGTNYPQMIVVANPSVGVTTDTTVTAAAATEETITTATITPTSKGVMEVRLISRSSSTTSTTHFDLLTSA